MYKIVKIIKSLIKKTEKKNKKQSCIIIKIEILNY